MIILLCAVGLGVYWSHQIHGLLGWRKALPIAKENSLSNYLVHQLKAETAVYIFSLACHIPYIAL